MSRIVALPARRLQLAAAVGLFAIAFLALAAHARADLYWTNELTKIGHAQTDGTGVDNELVSGAEEAFGIGADASHLYWGENTRQSIARADLEGSNVEADFIPTGGEAYGITVASGYVYWTEPGNGVIGRAKTDGTAVDPSFISGQTGPTGIAADASHLYWATSAGTIVRANLDGSGIESSFITGLFAPYGLTVNANHIYWSEAFFIEPSIGRANLDGTGVEKTFITGVQVPHAVLVDDNYIYWSDFGGAHAIGRANLDGTGVDPEFILSGELAFGMAINPPPPPPDPTPMAPVAGGAPTAPASAGPVCPRIEASAATFVPTPRPGKIVPGVRAKVSVSAPAEVRVDPTLIYKRGGKQAKVALPSTSFHAAATQKLRLALPAKVRALLPVGTSVRLSLRIEARPDAGSPCGGWAATTKQTSFKAKVVKVLTSGV